MVVEQDVRITQPDGAVVPGTLEGPDSGPGAVIFAHGSGSSRHSPRNRQVAGALHRRGLTTLLIDLLTEDEEREDLRSRRHRFDVALLADRLAGATAWLADQPRGGGRPVGYFGASTGAAAALVAAARLPDGVAAVVSRGGRPDLAGDALPAVRAPTLLVVGSRDSAVLELNRQAYERLRCPRRLEVVAGATHLFEEPGALDEVAHLAGDWFVEHLVDAPPPAGPAGSEPQAG